MYGSVETEPHGTLYAKYTGIKIHFLKNRENFEIKKKMQAVDVLTPRTFFT